MASRPPEHPPGHGPAASDPARARFFVISAVRLSAAALVIFGLLIANGVIDIDPIVGGILAFVGLIEFFFVPKFLAHQWRTPPA